MPCHLQFVYFFSLEVMVSWFGFVGQQQMWISKNDAFWKLWVCTSKTKKNRQFRRIFFQMSLNVKWFWLTGQFKRLRPSNDFIKLLLTFIFVLFFWSVTRRNCRLIKINSYRMSMHECFYWFIWMEKKQTNKPKSHRIYNYVIAMTWIIDGDRRKTGQITK